MYSKTNEISTDFWCRTFHIIDNSGGLEDLDRQKNFDKVYVETQRFLNTPPQTQGEGVDLNKKSRTMKNDPSQKTNTQLDGGTAEP